MFFVYTIFPSTVKKVIFMCTCIICHRERMSEIWLCQYNVLEKHVWLNHGIWFCQYNVFEKHVLVTVLMISIDFANLQLDAVSLCSTKLCSFLRAVGYWILKKYTSMYVHVFASAGVSINFLCSIVLRDVVDYIDKKHLLIDSTEFVTLTLELDDWRNTHPFDCHNQESEHYNFTKSILRYQCILIHACMQYAIDESSVTSRESLSICRITGKYPPVSKNGRQKGCRRQHEYLPNKA